MESNNFNIICYTGGACGDLLTALIDSSDAQFQQSTILHSGERTKLKKPFLFADDFEKDTYISIISEKYQSVPSHDIEYHINRNHEFIGITVDNRHVALWAANRFKSLHRPHVWDEMSRACGAQNVDDYAQILIDYSTLVRSHTKKIVALEDIVHGDAIARLANLDIDASNNVEFYKQWLYLQETTPV